ncbi:T9SS outer membrane translocon Sov/SprA [Aquirufa ecclesiirivi]
MHKQIASRVLITLFAFLLLTKVAEGAHVHKNASITEDTTLEKSGKRPRFSLKSTNPFSVFQNQSKSPFSIYSIKGAKSAFSFQDQNQLVQSQELGNISVQPVRPFSFQEYAREQDRQVNRSFWNAYSKSLDGSSSLQSRGLFPKIELPPAIDRIFGGNEVYFKPNGSLLLDIGYMGQFVDNPAIPVQLRYVGNLFFNEQAQINFQGKIGEKLNLNTNFDTKASFNFQNQLKLNWKTQEEDILQNIELGNTSWTLNSQLIPGVQNLFGLKTLMRFGNLDVTVVAAQQRSKQDCITLKGGAQGKSFEIRADQYDENRHFFLSSYFRNQYEQALKNVPMLSSGIAITRVEVYVTNRTQSTETLRNLISLSDLGESTPYSTNNPTLSPIIPNQPVDNKNNGLYDKLVNDAEIRKSDQASYRLESAYNLQRGTDFDMLKGAKRLNEREFKFHPTLGYLSLVSPLRNDEVLAVAYEYTLNGRKYKVGELTEDYQARRDDEVLVLKMLKSSTIRNNLYHPMWDLMMKNIYSLNTNGLAKQNFQLRIVYKDDATGIDNSNLIEGEKLKDIPLVKVLGLDKLNFAGDPQPDGNFDFVEELTIDAKNGRIIFPVLEPFGRNLKSNFGPTESNLESKYVFDELYRKTQSDALQLAGKNKFFLKGSFQSGMGSDIMLPFGVEAKSVTVSAGGQLLTSGTDFIVEGMSGRLKIINESIFSSGRELKICYEKPDLFSNQVRTLLGTRLDYNLGSDFHLGATFQNMSESPPAFFRRVAIGNEPVNNTLIGFDASLFRKSMALTRALDALPIVSTKEASVIDFQGEVAKLIPNVNDRVQGNAFIDDFEAARVVYNFSSQPTLWKPASTPKEFIVGNPRDLTSNFKRAKISAYNVDASIYGQGGFGLDVPGIDPNKVNAYAYERVVTPKGLFPNKDFANNITNLPLGVLDVAYFPQERGIYNFNTDLTSKGLLAGDPKNNFGAITRAINSDTDFDNANVEQIEFWLMNPFVAGEQGKVRDGIINKNNETGGKLVFHLGDISEDFIPDGFSNFENGIPAGEKITTGPSQNVEVTQWGIAPKRQFVINAFDNQAGRSTQDVGLDGLSNQVSEGTSVSEETYFKEYLNQVRTKVTDQTALTKLVKDPAGDDFDYYLNEKFNGTESLIERYKNFMGLENNSPTTANPSNVNFTEANSMVPDREDLNTDNTVNEVESYFKYEVDLKPGQLEVGKGYIVDRVTENGVDWYLFRIPIKDKPTAVGGMNSFKSIRFFRMLLTQFQEPVVLRFAQLQLSGYSYRKFLGDLDKKNGVDLPEPYDAKFKVSSVNIEENGPASKGTNTIPYVVPPGFVRDQDITTINNARLNEQSMSLCVDNLRPGDARAVFKNTSFDFINYKRLRMFVSMQSQEQINGKVAAFIRIGTDLTDNYYEVQSVGLTQTQKGQSLDLEIWPMENEFDIEFDLLKRAKMERDKQGKTLNERFSILMTSSSGKQYLVTVMGRPDQSASMTMMIGMRNISTDGPKSFCIWVNELRASDFDQTSGEAAVGKLGLKLADLGTIMMNGSFKNYGFGGVQSKISDRSRENYIEYGITANLNLEKFLPANWGFRIPFFITYDKRNISPQFDPLDPDIFLSNALETKGAGYAKLVEDNTERRGFNFTNVRKVKSNLSKRAYLWDFSNFTFSYAYSEMLRTSTMIQSYNQYSQRASILYSFTTNSAFWEPFNKWNTSSSWLDIIKDFNFNWKPSSFTVRAETDRSFIKTQLRNQELNINGVAPQFEKYWFFNRQYALNWNLTKSVIFNYNTMVNAIIDEPFGDIDTQAKRDSVMNNIKSFGRAKNFDQQAGIVWRLPLQKLPLTDWMNADYTHRIGYNYYANSFNIRDSLDLPFGNIIKNTRERAISGKVDFVSLYNRIRALRWANTPAATGKNVARNPGDEEEIAIPSKSLLKSFARLFLTLRGIQVNYSVNESTTLPGFLQQPGLFGLNGNTSAPGLDFVTGGQDDAIRFKAAQEGWLTKSTVQNVPFTQLRNTKFSYITQLEPNKDLRIQLEGNYNRGDNYQEFFRPTAVGGKFVSQNPLRSGNYSMSFLSFLTAFKDPQLVFDEFRGNREVLLARLNRAKAADGSYNINSQDVLIPSFFAAYSGVSAQTVKYSPFYDIPLPNWKVDYNGINLMPWLKKRFSSFTITHMYSSTYNVGNFISSLEYGQFENDYVNLTLNSLLYPLSSRFDPKTNTLIPVYVMSTISFSERFSPLIGFNAITKSRVSLRLEYNQDRNVGLNLSNSQVAELSNKDFTVSIGFTRANMLIPFKINGAFVRLPNDLRFNMNLTIRDTRTLQRKLDAETIVTQGFINFQFRPQITYSINNKLSVTAYFDKMMNNPLVSNSFYRSTVAGGFQIRYSLSE